MRTIIKRDYFKTFETLSRNRLQTIRERRFRITEWYQ